MVEVMISTLLVALIVVGTLSGFDSAGRASADERAHAQATLLAQQDEERLRGLTTAELGQIGTVKRSVTEGSTTFTVTSSARYVTAEKETFTCETNEGTADYLQTTSSVSWPALGTRAPVTESSIVSTPASAALLVKVYNQKSEPLEGATITLNGALAQTTPISGCVVYGGLSAGTFNVLASRESYVDAQGESPPPAKPVTVSGTALATTEFTIAPPGSITAEFENNEVAVTGDTFFAKNGGIATPSNFVGGAVGAFASSVTLKKLFPFAAPNAYTVFAGDCEKNNPEVIASPNPIVAGVKEVTDRTAQVEPNGIAPVKVEVPAVNITVYEGTKTTPGNPVTSASSAEITNTECAATNSQNFEPVPYEHKVSFDASGHMVPAYQPYAKQLEFCVVSLKSGTYYRYKSPAAFANLAKAGTTQGPFYLKETTAGYTKSPAKLEC
jgi:hypothetical protein